jgi:hypothetical protein
MEVTILIIVVLCVIGGLLWFALTMSYKNDEMEEELNEMAEKQRQTEEALEFCRNFKWHGASEGSIMLRTPRSLGAPVYMTVEAYKRIEKVDVELTNEYLVYLVHEMSDNLAKMLCDANVDDTEVQQQAALVGAYVYLLLLNYKEGEREKI